MRSPDVAVPATEGAHGGLVVVPDFVALGTLQSAVVAATDAEGHPAEAGRRAHQDAAPEDLSPAHLPHLHQRCPLPAEHALRENPVDGHEHLRHLLLSVGLVRQSRTLPREWSTLRSAL
jgi:hypothetical protein